MPTAQSTTKPSKPRKTKPAKRKIAKLVEQLAMQPDLTQRELAKINNISQAAVSQMFKRYGINDKYIESFKTHRADIFAGVQETVLASLSADDIKEASFRDRTVALGILYDKERLERGLSTQNSAVILASAVIEADKLSTVHPGDCKCDRCKIGISKGITGVVDAEIVDSNQ